MKIVLDASIGVKWFRYENESNTDLANKLLQQQFQNEIEIIVPDLFFFEIINTLLSKKYLNVDDIYSASESLHLMNMKVIFSNKKIIDTSINIADRTKLTFYDSLYISVAISEQALLLTEDKEILKNKSNFDFIKSLDEF
ncbi:MAG: PIN domain-containing protein [Actinobacteria bacterium]|nr:MAG: PIN domain-containing protein [Actinomycetota bacterium]